VRPIVTRTRVVILQHPRERFKPIGTARMAALSLVNSELHVGVDFGDRPAVAQALCRPAAPAVLLYPGPTAVLIDRLELPPPWTLVVVDGTWSQARKIVHVNSLLQGLPRVSFVPPVPSNYRIRPQPRPDYVCTIEALFFALGALEGEGVDLRPLLAPFRAMVDMQLDHRRRRLGLADAAPAQRETKSM
jgi:DTW domain-containing protein YfiP